MHISDRTLFLGAVVVYFVATIYSIFLWRRGFREDDRMSYLILLLGFGLHTMAMVGRGFSLSRCPVNNLYEATLFLMWTLLTTSLVVGAMRKIRFVTAYSSPVLFVIGVFALMPSLDKPDQHLVHGLASLHAALILLAYGAFGLSFVTGIMYLNQEHDLKFHKLWAALSRLPPIQKLETIIARLLLVGFVFLTAGLLVSPFLLKETQGVFFQPDAKIVWSIFVWFLYLGLLLMRRLSAQGGRKFAWGAVGSFSFVLLTFWGSNLLSALHNP